MKLSTITLLFLISVTVTGFSSCKYSDKPKEAQASSSEFYSINEGNQEKAVIAPVYNGQWFEELDKKYSWDKFEPYDNRFWEYMYNLFDTLPVLAKGKTTSDRDFFNKLTRGQKIFYAVLVFNGETDNGGVHQFFFNRPEFSFAVLESFKELQLDTLSQDYEKCLNQFTGLTDSYSKRKMIFKDSMNSWRKRWDSFREGYNELGSAKEIEEYYYKDYFKKRLYKTVVEYIDQHLDQFVKR